MANSYRFFGVLELATALRKQASALHITGELNGGKIFERGSMRKETKLTDAKLVERCLNGDFDAFELLLKR